MPPFVLVTHEGRLLGYEEDKLPKPATVNEAPQVLDMRLLAQEAERQHVQDSTPQHNKE